MDVIISHINADFDALASMLAAQKLYPEAKLVFPGSQEKNLRDFFVRSTFYVLEADRLKDIPMEKIDRLIVVDTRQRSRIGRFAEIIDSPGVEIHIYDHHPASSDDIQGSFEVIKETGATITILLTILRDRGISISPDEATVMMLGIYEDTGSLTFSSTTEDDFHAAAYLLSKGASLNIISDMITRELTAEQVFLLNDLIHSAERYNIQGTDVVVTTASYDRYVGDVAVLVHKFKDMENLDVIFALIRMEDRVYLIGRSRVDEINAAEVAVEFGGGGHATAASATVRDLTLVQAKEKLVDLLHTMVKPKRTAREIMISSPRTVQETDSLEQSHEILSRYYNINVLPVLRGERLVGLISRPTVEKAVLHGLGGLSVKEYMSTDFATVFPDTPLREVQGYIAGQNQRFLPVVKEGRLVGGITRTDLLRALHDAFVPSPQGTISVRKKGLSKLMEERLPPDVYGLLEDLGKVGESLGYRVYAVGGFVRDLILRRENYDIDVVVEGDGIQFAQVFGRQIGCRVKVHKRMKTAALALPSGYKIDVATARMEYYDHPAAPPTVELSSIKMDLYRRDFTINTLAIELHPRAFGNLLDFFEAQRDIKEGVIRVLHNLSFVEDPSRMFRAIRFEQRFGFQIGKHTQNLMKNAVSMGFLEKLSGVRLFAELELILREENPLSIIERMAEFDLLKFFHPALEYNSQTKTVLGRIYEVVSWFELLFLEKGYLKWMVYLFGFTDQLGTEERIDTLARRLALPPRYRKRLVEGRREAFSAAQAIRRKRLKPAEIYLQFNPLSTEVLLYMMARTEDQNLKRAISVFFTKLKNTEVSLRGRDLQRMGLPAGPVYRTVLDALLVAHLDGKVRTREDEIEFVKGHFLDGQV